MRKPTQTVFLHQKTPDYIINLFILFSEVSIMANFNELFDSFVSKVKGSADFGAVKNIYDKGTERAKAYTRLAKLNLEINADSEELKKVFLEIGQLYYEQNAASQDGFFASLFSQVDVLKNSIAAKQAELDSIRESIAEETSASDTSADADFEEVVSAEETFISCGASDDKEAETNEADLKVEIFEETTDFDNSVSSLEPEE